MDSYINLDCFAGGGGASLAMTRAGFPPHVAINHDPQAIAVHRANHPECEHFCQDVFEAKPRDVTRGRPIFAGWFSPDCTHHSKAKGGKPRDNKRRSLAWVVVDYASLPGEERPVLIFLENVEEFAQWGPLDAENKPMRSRRGETFSEWTAALRERGYTVGWFELKACDYGAPTTRNRLYLVARRDGQPIEKPLPTHARRAGMGMAPWRTAAEIIDWSQPCPSIFMDREDAREYHRLTGIRVQRPLKPKTMERIAKGVKRFVLDSAQPFIIPITHAGDQFRGHGIDDPLRTVTTANRGEMALVTPFITKFRTGATGHMLDEPLHTVTANSFVKRPGGATPLGLVAAHLTKFSENSIGDEPSAPLHTVMAGAPRHGLVTAFLAQHNNHRGGEPNAGREPELPLSTITAAGSQQGVIAATLIGCGGRAGQSRPRGLDEPIATTTAKADACVAVAHLLNLKGSGRHREAEHPMFAQCAGGNHIAEVRAFLMKYHWSGSQAQSLFDPLHTVDTKARFGLITIQGTDWQIVDIGMRMLNLRELARGQGLPDDYNLKPDFEGKPLSNTAGVRMVGNSVSPYPAEALIRANTGGCPMAFRSAA